MKSGVPEILVNKLALYIGRSSGTAHKIIDRLLLVPHVNVEGKQVNGRSCSSAQNLEESWEAVAIDLGLGRRRACIVRHLVVLIDVFEGASDLLASWMATTLNDGGEVNGLR